MVTDDEDGRTRHLRTPRTRLEDEFHRREELILGQEPRHRESLRHGGRVSVHRRPRVGTMCVVVLGVPFGDRISRRDEVRVQSHPVTNSVPGSFKGLPLPCSGGSWQGSGLEISLSVSV